MHAKTLTQKTAQHKASCLSWRKRFWNAFALCSQKCCTHTHTHTHRYPNTPTHKCINSPVVWVKCFFRFFTSLTKGALCPESVTVRVTLWDYIWYLINMPVSKQQHHDHVAYSQHRKWQWGWFSKGVFLGFMLYKLYAQETTCSNITSNVMILSLAQSYSCAQTRTENCHTHIEDVHTRAHDAFPKLNKQMTEWMSQWTEWIMCTVSLLLSMWSSRFPKNFLSNVTQLIATHRTALIQPLEGSR